MKRINLLQSIIIMVLLIGYCLLLCEFAKGQSWVGEITKHSLATLTKQPTLYQAVCSYYNLDKCDIETFRAYVRQYVKDVQAKGYDMPEYYNSKDNSYNNYVILYYDVWFTPDFSIVNPYIDEEEVVRVNNIEGTGTDVDQVVKEDSVVTFVSDTINYIVKWNKAIEKKDKRITVYDLRKLDRALKHSYNPKRFRYAYERQDYRDSVLTLRAKYTRMGKVAYRMWVEYYAYNKSKKLYRQAMGDRPMKNYVINNHGSDMPFLGYSRRAYKNYYLNQHNNIADGYR